MTPTLETKLNKILHLAEEVVRGYDPAERELEFAMRDSEVVNYLDAKRAEGSLPPPRLVQTC